MAGKALLLIGLVCILAGSRAKQMNYIATAEGKSFFGDRASELGYLNWTEAGEYCNSMGMKLASITSDAQANAIMDAYEPNLQGWFWTSARDAQTWRQFSWNETEEEVDSYVTILTSKPPPQTCLMFWYYGSSYIYAKYAVDLCEKKAGVLCERMEAGK